MPRPGRNTVGGVVYHVINRGNGRANVFHKEADQLAFLRVLSLACERHSMRLLGWCLMTNHFHLVLWPRRNGDLSKFMQWLTTCHVRRYHRHYGGGHVWQGRFRCFPVEPGPHLLTVLRYVERNPVRAGIVAKAQDWRFSSTMYWEGSGSFSRSEKVPDPFAGPAGAEHAGTEQRGQAQFRQTAPKLSQTPTDLELQLAKPIESWLECGPCERPLPWLRFVNRVGNRDHEADQLARIRESVNRGSPLGDDAWREKMARKLGLEATIRPRGRPRKDPDAKPANK